MSKINGELIAAEFARIVNYSGLVLKAVRDKLYTIGAYSHLG
jgi:hypothetical protein